MKRILQYVFKGYFFIMKSFILIKKNDIVFVFKDSHHMIFKDLNLPCFAKQRSKYVILLDFDLDAVNRVCMGLHHVITSCFNLFIYFSGFWLHHMTLVWTFINTQFRGEVIIKKYIYLFFLPNYLVCQPL